MSEGRENGEEMKILEVIDNYFPTVDGVVSVVHNYAVQLNRKAECTVLAPNIRTPRLRKITNLSRVNPFPAGNTE